MKQWNRNNMRDWVKERVQLEEEGYEIEELTPYHFRARVDWSTVAVDIWPSTRKMSPVGTTDVRWYGSRLVEMLAGCIGSRTWEKV